ncbi:MAG: hypothetical protein N3G20_11585 [Verrucomicrobiae bacterium]|nr:hypothetical protein [Verrucomicrobiae bacterium]
MVQTPIFPDTDGGRPSVGRILHPYYKTARANNDVDNLPDDDGVKVHGSRPERSGQGGRHVPGELELAHGAESKNGASHLRNFALVGTATCGSKGNIGPARTKQRIAGLTRVRISTTTICPPALTQGK